jgi:hypothetical protein
MKTFGIVFLLSAHINRLLRMTESIVSWLPGLFHESATLTLGALCCPFKNPLPGAVAMQHSRTV